MYRRPVLSSFVIGLVVAAVVTPCRIVYLDLATNRRNFVFLPNGSVEIAIVPAWSSPADWQESWVAGWMLGMTAGLVCLGVLWWPEPDPAGDEDEGD